MILEEYDIVKLYDKVDFKDVYVVVLKVNENTAKVKLLKQPSYNLFEKKYSDTIFKQYCHYDDEIYQQSLNFNRDNFTFEISESMWSPLSRDELNDLLQHLIYVDFTKDDLGKSIVTSAINKFKYT